MASTKQIGRAVAAATGRHCKSHQPDHSPAVFYVYVLRSEKTGRRYVGSSQNIDERLQQHNRGQSLATKHGAPWKLLHHEEFPTRAEAVRRERFFKTGKGRDFLDQLPE